MDEDFLRINPHIKRLYGFLKRYDIEEFFLKKKFKIALMEINADSLWKDIHNYVIRESEIAVLSPNYIGYVDRSYLIFINFLYLREREKFLNLFDYIIQEFILTEKPRQFNYEELMDRIIDCGFIPEELINMPFLSSKLKLQKGKQKAKKVKIEDLLEKLTEGDLTILEGIDFDKYNDIIEIFHIISNCFKWIYLTENILRKFIAKILTKEGYQNVIALNDSKLNDKIKKRIEQEKNKNYLPIRGDHDIYYLDLIDLNRFFQKHWNIFKNFFDSQGWITQKIIDLYEIRKRVAHNSGNLTKDELLSVAAYCKQIIKQVDPYI